jgi:hypothetical protein
MTVKNSIDARIFWPSVSIQRDSWDRVPAAAKSPASRRPVEK